MGKGNRNDQRRKADQVANADRYYEKERSQKKKKRSDKIIATVCVVFALLIVAVITLNVLSESGVFLRAQDAVYQEDIVVDAAMMSYFYNEYLMSWYNDNYSYLNYFSISFSSSLKNQQYGSGLESYFYGTYDGTWYDYFLDKVIENVDMYVTYANAAKNEKLELNDEDKAEIDDAIKSIKESLKASHAGYSDWYGKGVKESDVRRCYELIYLASKYSELQQDRLEETLDNDTDNKLVNEYIENNKSDFYTADYLSYKISLSSKNFSNDQAYEIAMKEAKAAADRIAAAKTPEEFARLVIAYENENKSELTTSADEIAIEKVISEDEVSKKLDELDGSMSYVTETGTGDSVGNWIFVENASEGDAKVVEESGTVTETETETETESASVTENGSESETETEKKDSGVKTYNTYTVTVYYITKASSLDFSFTKDMAYVVSNDKDYVESFVESFNNASEKDREEFYRLAEIQYDAIQDAHSQEHSDSEEHDEPVFSFNSVEKAADNYFASSYSAINDWLDTGALVDNTLSEIIEIKVEDDTYYAVVFFEKYNKQAWYVNAYNGYIEQEADAWYQAELDKKLITHNDKLLSDINTLIISSTSSN